MDVNVSGPLQTAGLGGMKPNTLALGFYSRDLPVDTFENLHSRLLKRYRVIRYLLRDQSLDKYEMLRSNLPPLRTSVSIYMYMYMYTARALETYTFTELCMILFVD